MARLFITCGIYQIVNKVNGKVYVGSAVDMDRRKSQHFYCLRTNTHSNPYLQNAYNCGQQLEFFVLEGCEESDLLVREQEYLDVLWDNGEHCYNVAKIAGKHITGIRTYQVKLLAPDGTVHGPIVGLGTFARKHDLYKENLSGLLNGRLKSYKGWTLLDGKSKRPQSQRRSCNFLSPKGKLYVDVRNFTEFAEKFELHYSGISKR